MEPSPAVETWVREHLTHFERFAQRITSFEVVIKAPHKHHHKGKLFRVDLHIATAGGEIVVNRAGPQDHAHEDVYVALRDAFDAAERKLEDKGQRRAHRVKRHEVPPHGKVARIFRQDGYGFLERSDGLEVYFHQNSVLGSKFAELEVGDEVRMEVALEEGEKGPQATTVRLIGKHHIP